MKYGTIPGVSKPVSRIVFGTSLAVMNPMPFGFPMPEEFAQKMKGNPMELLDAVYATGINTFDAAAFYGEETLGKWVESRGLRDQVVILTKGCSTNDYRDRVTTYDLLSDIHDSFVKLKTDYIDIYLLHRDAPDADIPAIMELLGKLHREGHIGAIGVSNWHHSRIDLANQYAAEHGLPEFVVDSPGFGLAACMGDPFKTSITFAGPEHADARKWAVDKNMAVFSYSSLGRGFFSGKYKASDIERLGELKDLCIAEYGFSINFEKLGRAEELAKEKGVTMTQIAFAWLLQQPMNLFAITSPSSKAHLDELIRAQDIELTPQELLWLNVESDARV